MAELTMPGTVQPASAKPSLDGGFNPLTIIIFCGFLAAGMLFTAYSLYQDVNGAGTMAANHSRLQMSTVRNFIIAWV